MQMSPEQLAALQAAMAAQSGGSRAEAKELTVKEALQDTYAKIKSWGTQTAMYGAVPFLIYAGMQACDVTLGDVFASIANLPLS